MHHTKKCRERIRKLLEESDNAEVLVRATRRQNEYVAGQVKAATDIGDSAVYGGKGDPGSSSRGGDAVVTNDVGYLVKDEDDTSETVANGAYFQNVMQLRRRE